MSHRFRPSFIVYRSKSGDTLGPPTSSIKPNMLNHRWSTENIWFFFFSCWLQMINCGLYKLFLGCHLQRLTSCILHSDWSQCQISQIRIVQLMSNSLLRFTIFSCSNYLEPYAVDSAQAEECLLHCLGVLGDYIKSNLFLYSVFYTPTQIQFKTKSNNYTHYNTYTYKQWWQSTLPTLMYDVVIWADNAGRLSRYLLGHIHGTYNKWKWPLNGVRIVKTTGRLHISPTMIHNFKCFLSMTM